MTLLPAFASAAERDCAGTVPVFGGTAGRFSAVVGWRAALLAAAAAFAEDVAALAGCVLLTATTSAVKSRPTYWARKRSVSGDTALNNCAAEELLVGILTMADGDVRKKRSPAR